MIITEKEMVNRMTDSLKKASDKAKEFTKVEASKKPALFVDFIHELKIAAGCSHQLAHSRIDQSPHWLDIRDNLEKIVEVSQTLPALTGEQNFIWISISNTLTQFAENIRKLFDVPGMSMTSVDQILQKRLENASQ